MLTAVASNDWLKAGLFEKYKKLSTSPWFKRFSAPLHRYEDWSREQKKLWLEILPWMCNILRDVVYKDRGMGVEFAFKIEKGLRFRRPHYLVLCCKKEGNKNKAVCVPKNECFEIKNIVKYFRCLCGWCCFVASP